MAYAGNIIVKKGRENAIDLNRFFAPVDKGSMKPAWTKERLVADMGEEVKGMEKNLKEGFVDAQHRAAYQQKLKERKQRYEDILLSHADAKKYYKENKETVHKRIEELKGIISESMPTLTDAMKGKANPFKIAKQEKEGLQELKREFQILAKIAGEESNIAFLQKD